MEIGGYWCLLVESKLLPHFGPPPHFELCYVLPNVQTTTPVSLYVAFFFVEFLKASLILCRQDLIAFVRSYFTFSLLWIAPIIEINKLVK